MSEQTAAASSPAEVDVFNGEQPSFDEYSAYRKTGKLPERFAPAEPAESAPDDTPEETATEGDKPESAGDSEAPKDEQEKAAERKPHLSASQRIAQIEATIEKIWLQDEPDTLKIAQLNATIEKIEQKAGLKRKAELAPAVQAPAHTQPVPQQQFTRPKPTIEDKNDDGSPRFTTYEDFTEHLGRWSAEQFWAEQQRYAYAKAQEAELAQKVTEAQARYGDAFVASRNSFTQATMGPNGEPLIPVDVLRWVSDSDLLADVVFTIGSNPTDLANFVQTARTNPRKAMQYVTRVEGLIQEELSADGKEAAKAPEPKKTQAPKPPSPVGGGSSRGFDVSDETLSADEWARKRNAQLARRNKA